MLNVKINKEQRLRAGPEFIGSRHCVPMAFTAERVRPHRSSMSWGAMFANMGCRISDHNSKKRSFVIKVINNSFPVVHN